MELEFFMIGLGVIGLTIYLAPFLWAQLLPGKTEAEIVSFFEVTNYNYRSNSYMPYFHYSILRFEANGKEHRVSVRRDKRDSLGKKIPVSYSSKYGVLFRRHWGKCYFGIKKIWDFNYIVGLVIQGTLVGALLLLLGVVSVLSILLKPDFWVETVLFIVMTAVVTAVFKGTYDSMKQKNAQVERVFETQEDAEQLHVFKRTIWDDKWCLYMTIAVLPCLFLILIMGVGYPELRMVAANEYWWSVAGFGGIVVFFALRAWWKTARKNYLLKNGQVVWATIDKEETCVKRDVLHIACFWFSKEDGTEYKFKTTYKKTTDNVKIDYVTKVMQEKQLAVVIKNGHPEKYEILLREHIFSYISDGWVRPFTCTKLLRIIQKES